MFFGASFFFHSVNSKLEKKVPGGHGDSRDDAPFAVRQRGVAVYEAGITNETIVS